VFLLDGKGRIANVSYPVRRAAYESLIELGEKPEKPVFERPPTPEEAKKVKQSGDGNNPN
jgi:hypothetical protein